MDDHGTAPARQDQPQPSDLEWLDRMILAGMRARRLGRTPLETLPVLSSSSIKTLVVPTF